MYTSTEAVQTKSSKKYRVTGIEEALVDLEQADIIEQLFGCYSIQSKRFPGTPDPKVSTVSYNYVLVKVMGEKDLISSLRVSTKKK